MLIVNADWIHLKALSLLDSFQEQSDALTTTNAGRADGVL